MPSCPMESEPEFVNAGVQESMYAWQAIVRQIRVVVPPGWESIPGLLKRLQIRAQLFCMFCYTTGKTKINI
jgi:hypothetical protein